MSGLLMFTGAIAFIVVMFVGIRYLISNTDVNTKNLDRNGADVDDVD